jgi:hypothetical protein
LLLRHYAAITLSEIDIYAAAISFIAIADTLFELISPMPAIIAPDCFFIDTIIFIDYFHISIIIDYLATFSFR